MAGQQAQRHDEAGILGNDRARGHTLKFQAAPNHEREARSYVYHVLHDGYEHGRAGVLHADEPPDEPVETEHGGGAPHAYMEITGRQRGNVGRGLYQGEHNRKQRAAQEQQHKGHAKGYRERAGQKERHLRQVATAQGLRRHAAGAHAQESEYPVDKVENHRPHGNGADIDGIAHVAHDGHIDQPEQRHGDVGHYRRQGYR